MSYFFTLKFIIVGDSSVGKSCLLLRFTDGRFKNTHDLTIGVEFGSRIVQFDQKASVKLQIWDTAGSEQFQSVTRSYYRGAICAILCYDITRRVSFQNCVKWLEDIQSYGSEKALVILVGNKLDLKDRRQVSYEEGEKFAKMNNLIFFETSALDATGVEEMFSAAARDVYDGILTQRFDTDD